MSEESPLTAIANTMGRRVNTRANDEQAYCSLQLACLSAHRQGGGVARVGSDARA